MPRGLTGARPSGRHRLAAAMPFRPVVAPPAQWGVVAPKYQMWGNDQYGDCTTAEEAANIANLSFALAIPEVLIPDAEVIRWCQRLGLLNGASLWEVMEALQVAAKNGLLGPLGKYYVGPPLAVNWRDRATLTAAIYEAQANIKIGIAHNCLPNEAGDANGWILLSCRKDREVDHCVGLCGYGPLAYLCGLCGVPVPSGADPMIFCYLLYTWSTVGIVSEAAMWNMTGEAWLRQPSSIQDPPYPTPTPPVPPVPPIPPVPPVPPVPTPNPCQALIDLLCPQPVPTPGPGPHPIPWPPTERACRALVEILKALQSRDPSKRPIPDAMVALAEMADAATPLLRHLDSFLSTNFPPKYVPVPPR